MTKTITEQLQLLSKSPKYSSQVTSKLIGIEKESLRYYNNGEYANNHHPKILGASLTHDSITTDYAESQLELITSPHHDFQQSLEELKNIHLYINHKLKTEQVLWPVSIPGELPRPKDIMTAKFGSSIRGQIKELYRTGLGYRYGKLMQLICGIHFNFSFSPQFWDNYFPNIEGQNAWSQSEINAKYMHVIRNYMRTSWITTYLFGSSPFIHTKFINKDIAVANYLKQHKDHTYLAEFGTSIRESSIGYHNKKSVYNLIDYNSLESYANSLQKAISTTDPEFEKIGLFRGNKQIQINTNILQIENEYYGIIRPKPNIKNSSGPVYKTLLEQGIYYIELRNLDINPFSNIGITLEQGLFLETLLYYCLLTPSPEFSLKDRIENKKNIEKVSLLGRQPDLLLKQNSENRAFKEWAHSIFSELKVIANYLDKAYANKTQSHTDTYAKVINQYADYIDNPELTNSAKIIKNIKNNNQEYDDYFLTLAKKYNHEFLEHDLDLKTQDYFDELVSKSIKDKQQEELNDHKKNVSLDEFFAEYYS